ncbi:nucleotide-diphospho-sugar transferase [Thelonectria olida]|uniref:Nucleotide-diphospho-sugar transferase n=1 Tax=Thelonectria olida TaxID=1576542 RepID=A0A9P9AR68_9HYPO|nr:nucleotide-diphospho-sugar transferase [Thelonectria olida]
MHTSSTPPAEGFTIPSGLLHSAVNAQNFQAPDRQHQQTHLDSLPRRARSSSLPSIIGEHGPGSRHDYPSRTQSPRNPPVNGFSNPHYHAQPTLSDQAPESRGHESSDTTPITKAPGQNSSGLVRSISRALSRRNKRSSIYDVYEKAKLRGVEIQRQRWSQLVFEYTIYTLLLCFIYFVLVGMPLWRGAYKLVMAGGFTITIGVAALYAFMPLLVAFEPDPPPVQQTSSVDKSVQETALLIPCYKAATIIGPTLEAATKIFPPQNIFVIANGNSPQPLDDTEEVCRPYGVNHIWSPVGSKIVAQFVGCYAADDFKNVLLIDDDCALPPNFPIVSGRLQGSVKCIGYAIKSVGPDSSKGTYCQQAQDLEYKISGLQRTLAGKIGSATFPHGAISLWDRKFLVKTFYDHEGFSVSEDWFMGHSCRRLGGRIQMCTSVFVETETPPAVFFNSGGSRGGFGEMTVFKQRFHRWNFFFVNGMWYNMAYVFKSWKLGVWEVGTKFFVLQEVYETLLYLMTPFVLPISMIVRPGFCSILLAATILLYLVNVVIFNEVHLRRKKERISYVVLIVYYMPYKMALSAINVASCYWSLFKYAKFFAQRHPKVVEDERAVEVVVRLQGHGPRDGTSSLKHNYGQKDSGNKTRANEGSLPVEPQRAAVRTHQRTSFIEDMV